MNIFKELIINKNAKEINNNIYASSERILEMIDNIQSHASYQLDEFKLIYRLIYTFMMASTSLLPGTLITKEQSEAFIKVGELFAKKQYPYPLLTKENIKLLFESPQAVAMINNATINPIVKEHGVKQLWDIFRISVSDFRMFCFDYLNVAYSLSRLKDINSFEYNTDMYKQIAKNMEKEFNITFDEDDLELYEFRTDIDVS